MFSRGFFDDYEKSIKNKAVEEGFDLFFSRPLGYIIAKILSKLHFSPTGISVFGMLIGVTGGSLFFWQDSLLYTATGGLLVIIAGVFDSADGQAARLNNTHTEMGRYLDMFNDMLVFISCYVGGIFYFADTYTILGCTVIGLVSGFIHSLKSNIYEYYKGEYLHFSGTDSKQRNDSLEYIKENFDRSTLLRKITYPVLIDYVRRQNKNKFRDDEITEIFEEARETNPTAFKQLYERKSRKILAGWAWVCGSNIMRNSIIISCLFARFDIYAFLNIASYLLFLYVGRLQNKVDRKILEELESWDLNSLKEANLQLQR